MSEPAAETPSSNPAPAIPTGPAQMRLGTADLPRAFHALASALGEAGVGAQQLPGIFASGVRAVCTGCGMTVTGLELNELVMASAEESEARLPPKLERLRLGYCPRQGCEARFYTLELAPTGGFDPAAVLARLRGILDGEKRPVVAMKPAGTPATRRATQRLALIALGTLFVAFVAYRLIYYRSQPIPFIEPKSPFQVDPSSLSPPPR